LMFDDGTLGGRIGLWLWGTLSY